MPAEWFKDWFNSPYYYLLYNNRNESEANLIINNLYSYLNLKQRQNVWDLACGKGRHAIALNKKGLNVSEYLFYMPQFDITIEAGDKCRVPFNIMTEK